MVVVDEDWPSSLIDIETLEMQAGDLPAAPTGVLEQQVDKHAHLPGAIAEHPASRHRPRTGDGSQQVDMRVQRGDDLPGECPAGLVLGSTTKIAPPDDEGGRKIGHELGLPRLAQDQGHVLDDPSEPLGAVGLATSRLERRGACQESLHVGTPEGGRVLAAAGAAGEHRREHPHRVNAAGGAAGRAPTGQGTGRPALHGLA